MSYKISVIIPTYNIIKENSKNTFDRTINSLKKQSIGFENLEIIIVDDNSNQESKDFLEKLDKEHENIKVIFLLENNGSPSKPRNVGIKNSTTDYIMFLDQDDTFTQKSCEVMYNTINNKHADIVSSNYIIKMNNNKYVAFHENPLYKEFNPNHSLNKFQKQYAPWARIFRKSLLDKLKLPDKILLEDSYMNFNAFIKSQKVIYLNDFFSYQYTVNEESITLNSKKSTIIKGLDGIREIILVLNKYPDNIPLVIDDLFSMVLQTLLMFNFSISENKKILKMFKELEEEIITDSRYIYNENKIMSKPIWAKFLNYFIKNDLLLIGSIITKFIQIILNNQFIKKNIFTKIFKHEPYDEKINNTYGY